MVLGLQESYDASVACMCNSIPAERFDQSDDKVFNRCSFKSSQIVTNKNNGPFDGKFNSWVMQKVKLVPLESATDENNGFKFQRQSYSMITLHLFYF